MAGSVGWKYPAGGPAEVWRAFGAPGEVGMPIVANGLGTVMSGGEGRRMGGPALVRMPRVVELIEDEVGRPLVGTSGEVATPALGRPVTGAPGLVGIPMLERVGRPDPSALRRPSAAAPAPSAPAPAAAAAARGRLEEDEGVSVVEGTRPMAARWGGMAGTAGISLSPSGTGSMEVRRPGLVRCE